MFVVCSLLLTTATRAGSHSDTANLHEKLLTGEPLYFSGTEPAKERTILAAWIVEAAEKPVKVHIGYGLILGTLDLQYTTMNEEVSLVACTFIGGVDFSHTIFRRTLDLSDSVFATGLNFTGATLENDFVLNRARFSGGDADFREFHAQSRFLAISSIFEQSAPASFDSAHFDRTVTFDNSSFKGGVSFVNSEFGSDASFERTLFGKGRPSLSFERSKIRGDLFFAHARITGDADFFNMQAGGNVDFSGSVFNGKALFGASRIERSAFFSTSTFASEAHFTGIEIGGDSDFEDIAFGRSDAMIIFDNAKFGGQCSFDRSKFKGKTVFRDTVFKARGRFDDAQFIAGSNPWFVHTIFSQGAYFPGQSFSTKSTSNHQSSMCKRTFKGLHFLIKRISDQAISQASLILTATPARIALGLSSKRCLSTTPDLIAMLNFRTPFFAVQPVFARRRSECFIFPRTAASGRKNSFKAVSIFVAVRMTESGLSGNRSPSVLNLTNDNHTLN